MKIWLDITNAPHVIFFLPFIKKWKLNNYEIIITTRDYSNTIDLLKKHNLNYTLIGKHGGKNSFLKILNFFNRVFLLFKFLRNKKICVGISHSSFYQPIASKLISIPCIYINDNEHAYGNYFAFPFASVILLPESLQNLYKIFTNKIMFYPGVKEGIYLSQMDLSPKKANKSIKKVIYRPGPWLAQYHDSRKSNDNNIIKYLYKNYDLTLIPRDKNQYEFYSDLYSSINVVNGVLSLDQIYLNYDMFVGSGGTMTRELAVLGVPSYNNYSGNKLKVDMYLEKKGFFLKTEKIFKIPNKINNSELLSFGETSFNLINSIIDGYKKS